MLSPLGYQPPAELAAIDQNRNHRVFVYGTLRSPAIRWLVIGRAGNTAPAVLNGYRKDGLDITAENEAQVKGLVFEVNANELQRLDRYERLGLRYKRVSHIIDNGDPVWVYQRLP
jgi:gamma-glutamylcyclotransferase (GGCT)/AIG2-like uncharacterized protein YtfP